MSLMTSLSVGVTGLKTAQTAVNTTAHNIANVNTEGYTRQEVLSTDKTYNNNLGSSHISYNQVGLGTEVAVIKQNRNQFYDKAYRLEVGRQGFYQAQSDAVTEVESLMGEMEGVQFQNTLNDLWSSVQELGKEPDSIVKRTALINTAYTFLLRAQDIQDQLEKYQENLNTQIQDAVNEMNSIAYQIHDLNKLITKAESGLENANDYRDQRNLLLDQLAEYASISYYEDLDGRVVVNVEGAQFVSQDYVYEMHTQPVDETTKLLDVVWATDNPVFNLEQGFASRNNTDVGKLKGLLIARGDKTANYLDIPDENNAKYYTSGTFDAASYNLDVQKYNNTVGSSILMNTQASFDRLIHGVVTAINDALNPNMDMSDAASQTAFKQQWGVTVDDDTKVTFKLKDGTTTTKKLKDVKIWDEYLAGVGMDENDTPREELFERQSVERYTMGEVTDKNGNKKTVWIYNEENSEDPYTQYTTKQLVVNEDIKENPSLLPLSGNNHKGNIDGYDVDTVNRLEDIWKNEFGTINPNVLTEYTFTDYYQAFIGDIATVGKEYDSMVERQENLTENIESNRQSVAGVSSDEQLTYLIMYQYAYTASSRYISTVDQMLEHLLNKLG